MQITNNYVHLRGKKYPIISEPVPHILIPTTKKLHGWWKGKRECTAERMLINPYSGCSVGCFYCYSLSYPGYFQLYRKRKIIVVAEDFDKRISQQLDSIDVASCGYLSPVSDPFQLINEKYHLSEKIISEFIKRNIPIDIVTKSNVSKEVLEKISSHQHSFLQVSILTGKESLRKILSPGGASTSELFKNIKRAKEKNIYTVARIDPIFPFITDDIEELEKLVQRIKRSGADHIITSILDIPLFTKKDIISSIKEFFGNEVAEKYNEIYTENIDGWLNADIGYRKKIFSQLREICERENISFALCMEYELEQGEARGLNKKYSNVSNCEGINIPIYLRNGDKFRPASDCRGNCLNCKEAKCGIKDLAMGREGSKKDWKLKDYRRWSRELRG